MTLKPSSLRAGILRADFGMFVPYAFKKVHDENLGDQKYIFLMVYAINRLLNRKTRRLLINLPPQHLKSFVGSLCLAAFLLGTQPRLRILLLAYNDDFAANLAGKIRAMMQTPWYQAIFPTRLKDGHSRINDFETTEGGGIYAVSATGAITGRPADFIIYDDPHEIKDWNNDEKLKIARSNFNTVISRLPDKVNGPMIVIAHRVGPGDLSAYILEQRGWESLRLALVAPKTRTYDLGHEDWIRKKGDLLQPKVYPKKLVKQLKSTQIEPPWGWFYQQGVDPHGSFKPRADHFMTYEPRQLPIGPVVLSVDPGQSGGSNASRSVIQAWKQVGKCYYLIDQFCDHCNPEQLKSRYLWFISRYRPGAILIEKTASGPALYYATRQRVKVMTKLITPTDSKAIRLARHHAKIRGKRIHLPIDAPWREAFIDEIVGFPGEFDDQIDAMTQCFDFLDTKPLIPPQPPRDSGIAVVLGSRRWG